MSDYNINEIEKLKDFNIFFFYGELDQDIEDASDMLAGLVQDKRSLYYYRNEGSGVSQKENYPNAISLTVGLKYDIASWAGFRNTQVSDGTGGTRDRRIAVSQNQITFNQDQQGNLDIDVLYIPFRRFEKATQLNIPISGGM